MRGGMVGAVCDTEIMTERDWIEECNALQEGHFARNLCTQGWSGFGLCSTLDPPPVDQWVAHATTEEEMQ